jgi:hypothetical protein
MPKVTNKTLTIDRTLTRAARAKSDGTSATDNLTGTAKSNTGQPKAPKASKENQQGGAAVVLALQGKGNSVSMMSLGESGFLNEPCFMSKGTAARSRATAAVLKAAPKVASKATPKAAPTAASKATETQPAIVNKKSAWEQELERLLEAEKSECQVLI